jgi:hypothetical protein
MNEITQKFDDSILSLSDLDLSAGEMPNSLLIGQEDSLSVYYAPLDWVNTHARVVVVGITPGKTQAINALQAYREARQSGEPMDEALRIGKQTGAFSGSLRGNLVSLLDHIRLNQWLGIDSCDTLFGTHGSHNGLLHSTSVLQFPVFKNGDNYNGTPSIKSSALLRNQLQHSARILRQVPDALIIPLGPKVIDGLELLVRDGVIQDDRILKGLPHPSGANAERIKYFLGLKERSALSSKVNPDTLDRAKVEIKAKMDLLLA